MFPVSHLHYLIFYFSQSSYISFIYSFQSFQMCLEGGIGENMSPAYSQKQKSCGFVFWLFGWLVVLLFFSQVIQEDWRGPEQEEFPSPKWTKALAKFFLLEGITLPLPMPEPTWRISSSSGEFDEERGVNVRASLKLQLHRFFSFPVVHTAPTNCSSGLSSILTSLWLQWLLLQVNGSQV